MSRTRSEYLDADPSGRSVAADVHVREEPDEEEDEEDDGQEEDDDEDDDDKGDDEGYSELKRSMVLRGFCLPGIRESK